MIKPKIIYFLIPFGLSCISKIYCIFLGIQFRFISRFLETFCILDFPRKKKNLKSGFFFHYLYYSTLLCYFVVCYYILFLKRESTHNSPLSLITICIQNFISNFITARIISEQFYHTFSLLYAWSILANCASGCLFECCILI